MIHRGLVAATGPNFGGVGARSTFQHTRLLTRLISHESGSNSENSKKTKRFIQTIQTKRDNADFFASLNYNVSDIKTRNSVNTTDSLLGSKWTSYKLDSEPAVPVRRSRASRFKKEDKEAKVDQKAATREEINEPVHEIVKNEPVEAQKQETKPKKRRVLRPRKAIITLSPNAVTHLRGLMDKPDGKHIRVGVLNRGCSGLTYNLEYVNEAGKFDELVEQDGVKVFIDSKALFSIVGSEMDWLEDKLSSRFIFKNPNSKGTCGCGESFMV